MTQFPTCGLCCHERRFENEEKHFGCTESYDIADIQTDSRNGGYYTVGKNKQKIAEYIRRQMDEDKLGEQLTMFGKDDDPFKGGR